MLYLLFAASFLKVSGRGSLCRAMDGVSCFKATMVVINSVRTRFNTCSSKDTAKHKKQGKNADTSGRQEERLTPVSYSASFITDARPV